MRGRWLLRPEQPASRPRTSRVSRAAAPADTGDGPFHRGRSRQMYEALQAAKQAEAEGRGPNQYSTCIPKYQEPEQRAITARPRSTATARLPPCGAIGRRVAPARFFMDLAVAGAPALRRTWLIYLVSISRATSLRGGRGSPRFRSSAKLVFCKCFSPAHLQSAHHPVPRTSARDPLREFDHFVQIWTKFLVPISTAARCATCSDQSPNRAV